MSLRVVVRPSAETYLLESALFIAEDDPAAAQRFLDEAEKGFTRLAEFPEIGRPRTASDPSLAGQPHSMPVRSVRTERRSDPQLLLAQRPFLPSRIEPVAHPGLGDEIPGVGRIGLELLAQLSHEHAQVFRLLL